jgi:hypothetical protein
MTSFAIFGGSTIDGRSLQPGERLSCFAMFGGFEIDLTAAPTDIAVSIVTIFGGAKVIVRPDEDVILDGMSIFGGRSVEPAKPPRPKEESLPRRGHLDDDLPLDIFAYCLFGGVSVERAA